MNNLLTNTLLIKEPYAELQKIIQLWLKGEGKVEENNNKETAKALNDLARHQLICKIYADILADMQVCEVEGWNKLEFIQILQEKLNSLYIQKKKGF